jgi:4-hydroxybenzoate polyprenyltransferase
MIKMYRKITKALIYSKFYLAFGALSVMCACSLILGVVPNIYLSLSVFLLFLSLYNLNTLSDLNEDVVSKPERTVLVLKHKRPLAWFSGITFVLTLLLMIFTKIELIIFPLVFVAFAFVYSSGAKITPFRLKDTLLLKNVIVAFCWAFATVLPPVIYYGIGISQTVLILFLFVFLRILLGGIFFDLRDVEGDKRAGVRTLPVVFGNDKTVMFLHSLNVLSAILILVGVLTRHLPEFALSLELIFAYGLLYLYAYDKKPSKIDFLCDIIVDGEYLFTAAVIWLGTLFFTIIP